MDLLDVDRLFDTDVNTALCRAGDFRLEQAFDVALDRGPWTVTEHSHTTIADEYEHHYLVTAGVEVVAEVWPYEPYPVTDTGCDVFARHMAAEGDPQHVRHEAALWGLIGEAHTPTGLPRARRGPWRRSRGKVFVPRRQPQRQPRCSACGVPFPCATLATAVDAARAWVTAQITPSLVAR